MKRKLEYYDLASEPDSGAQICWKTQLKVALRTSILDNSLPFVGKSNCFDISEDHLQLVFNTFDDIYLTHSDLLTHTKISPLDREKLKSWLLSQTKNLYCRQTYATASRFLDMFFMQRQHILRSEFQLLGLACLMLATKIIQSRIPAISFDVFNKSKILDFEKTLIKVFNYRLNPPTYIDIAQLVLHYWDAYLKKDRNLEQVKYWKDSEECIRRCRAFFQTLDCLDLVIHSLAFHVTDLVFYTFFIEHRRNCLLELRKKKYNVKLVQDTEFRQFHELYCQKMFLFFKDLQVRIPVCSSWSQYSKINSFVLKISRISPKIEVRAFKKFREQILRQTYNEEISLIARNILR